MHIQNDIFPYSEVHGKFTYMHTHTHTHTHSHTHSPSHLILMENLLSMGYHAGHRGWQAYKERLPVLMETKTRYATHKKYTITNGNQRMEGR